MFHITLALAKGPATSEALAAAMHTNPLVLRRVMGGLMGGAAQSRGPCGTPPPEGTHIVKHIDFAVIGGNYAGMAAALQLARACRQVLVVDAGQRRNRFVDAAGETSHGLLTQDGRPPR